MNKTAQHMSTLNILLVYVFLCLFLASCSNTNSQISTSKLTPNKATQTSICKSENLINSQNAFLDLDANTNTNTKLFYKGTGFGDSKKEAKLNAIAEMSHLIEVRALSSTIIDKTSNKNSFSKTTQQNTELLSDIVFRDLKQDINYSKKYSCFIANVAISKEYADSFVYHKQAQAQYKQAQNHTIVLQQRLNHISLAYSLHKSINYSLLNLPRQEFEKQYKELQIKLQKLSKNKKINFAILVTKAKDQTSIKILPKQIAKKFLLKSSSVYGAKNNITIATIDEFCFEVKQCFKQAQKNNAKSLYIFSPTYKVEHGDVNSITLSVTAQYLKLDGSNSYESIATKDAIMLSSSSLVSQINFDRLFKFWINKNKLSF